MALFIVIRTNRRQTSRTFQTNQSTVNVSAKPSRAFRVDELWGSTKSTLILIEEALRRIVCMAEGVIWNQTTLMLTANRAHLLLVMLRVEGGLGREGFRTPSQTEPLITMMFVVVVVHSIKTPSKPGQRRPTIPKCLPGLSPHVDVLRLKLVRIMC